MAPFPTESLISDNREQYKDSPIFKRAERASKIVVRTMSEKQMVYIGENVFFLENCIRVNADILTMTELVPSRLSDFKQTNVDLGRRLFYRSVGLEKKSAGLMIHKTSSDDQSVALDTDVVNIYIEKLEKCQPRLVSLEGNRGQHRVFFNIVRLMLSGLFALGDGDFDRVVDWGMMIGETSLDKRSLLQGNVFGLIPGDMANRFVGIPSDYHMIVNVSKLLNSGDTRIQTWINKNRLVGVICDASQ